MIIGVKDLTWAKFSSGGEGSACAYTSGTAETDLMVRVDQSEERDEQSFYADDKRIDHSNGIRAANLSLELAKLPTAMLTDLLGETSSGTTAVEYAVTEADAPFVGIGFVTKHKYKGTISYEAFWYYKMQFSRGNRSFNTKGESLQFQTESLDGAGLGVTLASGGDVTFYCHEFFTTETAATAWLATKAGISSQL